MAILEKAEVYVAVSTVLEKGWMLAEIVLCRVFQHEKTILYQKSCLEDEVGQT